jgi:hypothetical protein
MFKAALCTLAVLSPLAAAEVFVPGGYADTEGNWENRFPFTSSTRYQQVWDGSLFAATGPIEITSIAFRVDGPNGAGFAGAPISGPQIRLSTTAANEDTLSTTFAANVGADEVLVRDTTINSLHLSSSASFTGFGTRVFDVVIEFDESFFYDPSQGNLLLDVQGSLIAASPIFFDGAEHEGDGMSRIFSTTDPNSGFKDSGVVIAQFNYNVPAPSALALLGLSSLAATRRRR